MDMYRRMRETLDETKLRTFAYEKDVERTTAEGGSLRAPHIPPQVGENDEKCSWSIVTGKASVQRMWTTRTHTQQSSLS